MSQLPPQFTPVETGLPTHDRPVLAIRVSGYISCRYEVITARHQPDYRPRSPWRDLSGDSVHDDGASILGWCEMDEWFQPHSKDEQAALFGGRR